MLVTWPILICLSTVLAIPSQYEASCYQGCHCDKEEYKCENLRLRDTEVFKHAIPKIYESLDTVIVTGNKFGDLSAENLFGGNVRHERLSSLDLSRNGITSFGIQTFIGASRVENLNLAHNNLSNFADPQPLNFLTSLRTLNLNSVFGNHASVEQRADLLQTLFSSNHSFMDLFEINLSNNRLKVLRPNTFCNVKGLSRLILSYNLLSDFTLNVDCLEGLSALELRGNRFVSVPAAIWKNLPSLNTLDVSKNPLHCTCDLQDFHEFAVDTVNIFLAQQETLCELPQRHKGKAIFEIGENFCRGQGGFLHWLILLCVATVIFYLYRWYRKSGKAHNFKLFKGYSPLEPEAQTQPTQPAFV